MSVVLLGSTSGSITLQEPAVAGSTVLTLPAVTGTVLTDTSPKAGNVIQVVQGKTTTQISTTSTSYVTTGLTASITPSSSSSKILVTFIGEMQTQNGAQVNATIYRNSTDLATGSGGRGFVQLYNGAGELQTTVAGTVLDSPATTSSTTYTIYMKRTGSGTTVFFAGDSVDCIITLQEIAA